MNNIKTIHQFTPSMEIGDSVSNGVLYIQKLLKELGFVSEIYVLRRDLNINFKHNIHHISEYKPDSNNTLFYHHSIGHDEHDNIMSFEDKKVMIYHNITPAHFFKNSKYVQGLCNQGRDQLASSSQYFIASFGDSDYNCDELRYHNYPNPMTLTLLLDFEKQDKYEPNQKLIQKHHKTYNIIFVGRVVSNKVQHQLIDVAFALKNRGIKNFKIHIVGGASEPKYMKFLKEYRDNLNLQKEINITGKVSDEDLVAYYHCAELYLSLSEHEGFGMPLVEAMKYDIPVFAFNAGGTATTIPKEGLLEKKSPSFIAEQIIKLQKDPYFRVNLIKKQKVKLESFSKQNIKNKLISYLNETLILELPNIIKKPKTQNLDIQIEGPFDSSYSLAIVNKNIALALDAKLYSTEGGGDFKADLSKVEDTVKSLALKKLDNVDVTIRNLYPPRTNAMLGYHKIIGPYGWEESKFPKEYVEWFNTKLTMVFSMSDYVTKLLKENGVYIPIVTIGLVVEDILKIESKPLSFDLPKGFKVLHISSAFPRKGINLLLEAFELFDNYEISLIMKIFPNPHNNIVNQLEELNYNIVKIYEEDVCLYEKNSKQILLINKDISQKQIKYLYENSDVLVAPSFGEGFGLPMAEAMLLELPVITTKYSGQIDFCKDNNSWLLDFDFEYAKTHMNLKDSIWAVPKVLSIKEKILEVKQNVDSSKLKKAKEYILKNYSSTQIASNIQQAIDNYKMEPKIETIAWISSYNTKCGLATYSDFIIQNFSNITVKKFANYTDSIIDKENEIDVIRCWKDRFDIDNTELINNILNSGITNVVINFNFAFFSMNNLEQIIDQLIQNKVKITIIFHSVADVKIEGLEASLLTITKSLSKVNKMLVHNINDLNFLKDLGLINTAILPHGVHFRKGIKLKQNEQVLNIASYGFLLKHKGILDLIDVFSELSKEYKNIKLILVNALYPAKESKDYFDLCRNRVKELGLTNKVTFHTKFLDDSVSYKLLDEADLLVMPYHKTNESASGAIRYAMSTLKPTLCTNQPIFNDVKDIAHFVDGDTNTDMLNSMRKLIVDKKLLYSKSDDQKKWVQEHDWRTIASKVLNFLR
ncbi:MAG: glycosyltransferase [Campylobacterota bacterium]|nr:glycosyltransferase [Campylobacterota bacterium]